MRSMHATNPCSAEQPLTQLLGAGIPTTELGQSSQPNRQAASLDSNGPSEQAPLSFIDPSLALLSPCAGWCHSGSSGPMPRCWPTSSSGSTSSPVSAEHCRALEHWCAVSVANWPQEPRSGKLPRTSAAVWPSSALAGVCALRLPARPAAAQRSAHDVHSPRLQGPRRRGTRPWRPRPARAASGVEHAVGWCNEWVLERIDWLLSSISRRF